MTTGIQFISAVVAMASTIALAQSATFTVKTITPEAALKAAQAALAKCRDEGFQVSVAVVDRGGVTQVVIRDRFAAPHTVEISTNKAQAAVSFKMNTAATSTEASRPGESHGGHSPYLPAWSRSRAGMMIEGAADRWSAASAFPARPGPADDDVCAAAGIKAIADSLEF